MDPLKNDLEKDDLIGVNIKLDDGSGDSSKLLHHDSVIIKNGDNLTIESLNENDDEQNEDHIIDVNEFVTTCISDVETIHFDVSESSESSAASSKESQTLSLNNSLLADHVSLENKDFDLSSQVLNITAITLADGSTAIVQSNLDELQRSKDENTEYIKAEAVQLENGTTAYISLEDLQKLSGGQETHEKSDLKFDLSKIITGQTIELEDGSAALLSTDEKGEEVEVVQLPDGSTAYISSLASTELLSNSPSSPNINLESFTVPNLGMTEEKISNQVEPCSVKLSEDMEISDPSQNNSTIDPDLKLENTFKCPFKGCDKVFASLHQLKVHSRVHIGGRIFKCDLCSKNFSSSYGLKSHIRVHTGERPYKCIDDKCGKSFNTSSDLQKHIRTHTGERPFKCMFEGCDRSFTTSNIRKVHMRVHTGERPYTCSYPNCGKSFSSATNHKNHVRIHTGEKPYVCMYPKCCRRFTEYSSLYKHHVVHTMAKPYTCEVCRKTYRQISTLVTHKRKYHGTVDTVLQADDNENVQKLNTNSPIKLMQTDELIADGNIIVAKTCNVNTPNDGSSADGDVKTANVNFVQELSKGNSCTISQSVEGTISVVENCDEDLHQQIYVLADSSQLALIQEQFNNGQLVATIPIDANGKPNIVETVNTDIVHTTNDLVETNFNEKCIMISKEAKEMSE